MTTKQQKKTTQRDHRRALKLARTAVDGLRDDPDALRLVAAAVRLLAKRSRKATR